MTTSAPMLGEPPPVELMNTIWADRSGVHDSLADAAGLAGWLEAAAVTDPVLARDPAALPAFRALRDALRVLAAEVTDDTRPSAIAAGRDVAAAAAVLNRCCAAAPAWSQLAWPLDGRPSRQVVTAAGLAESVVARIAERGAELFGSDQCGGLRACWAPGCVLYFLREHPRRQWCSAECGNRARVARHYARHHGSPATRTGPPPAR
ncbi:MAG: ABATE domain-containing protein [Actinomycetota bacterium]